MTDNTPQEKQASAATPRKESMLANLLVNIIIPTLILSKLSTDDYLGTKWAMVVALAFPLGYGLRDLLTSRKINFYSGLGIVSIMLTCFLNCSSHIFIKNQDNISTFLVSFHVMKVA